MNGDGETDMAGLGDANDAPLGAIEPADGPPRVRRTQFWPERTPVAGATPVLPDEVVIALSTAAKAASKRRKKR